MKRSPIWVAAVMVTGVAAPGMYSQITVDASKASVSVAVADAERPIAFEIVSIRSATPEHISGQYFTDDGYSVHAITAHTLLTYMSKTLAGVPDWCMSERYDVVAKIAEADYQFGKT